MFNFRWKFYPASFFLRRESTHAEVRARVKINCRWHDAWVKGSSQRMEGLWNDWWNKWRIQKLTFERSSWDMQSWCRSSVFWWELPTRRREGLLRVERRRVCWVLSSWNQCFMQLKVCFIGRICYQVSKKRRSAKIIFKCALKRSQDKRIKLNAKIGILNVMVIRVSSSSLLLTEPMSEISAERRWSKIDRSKLIVALCD